MFTTHAIKGLSENDFICAAKIDRIPLAELSFECSAQDLARADAGSSPASAQRAADEDALQFLTAVDPAEPALREAGERAGAVGEQAVERVDGGAHHLGFGLAPAFVAAQDAQRAGVFAFTARHERAAR